MQISVLSAAVLLWVEKRSNEKKSILFLHGEVFFLLTYPLMGDPIFQYSKGILQLILQDTSSKIQLRHLQYDKNSQPSL